jgi:DNA-binding NarL/FixJ family response regulator
MADQPLRILLVDDQPNVRDAVRNLLASRTDWEVCGEAGDGHEAIERTKELHPDVIIMDMSMPRLNGLDATREIHERFPNSQVVILTFHDFPGLAELAREAGARACVLKGHASEFLVQAVENVSAYRPFSQGGCAL